MNGDGFADIVVSSASNAPVTVYAGSRGGLSTTPAAMLMGPSDSAFAPFVYKAGDVNGDGFSDVLVDYLSLANPTDDQVRIFLGSATGVSTTAAAMLTAPQGEEFFSFDCLGDVNGDGSTDLGLGVATEDGAAPGTILVYLGSRMGLGTTPAATLTTPPRYGPAAVAGVGDVNGDGFGDVGVFSSRNRIGLTELWIYLGGAGGPSAGVSTVIQLPESQHGYSLASAGDVNHDGFDDVVFAASNAPAAGAHVFVYLGSAGGLSNTAATDLVGAAGAIGNAGDVNGDGYSDVFVVSSAGSLSLYHGSGAGLSAMPATQLSPPAGSTVHWSVAPAGDVDGDGFADMVIGEVPAADGTGRVSVYRGSATGLATTPAFTINGDAGSGFGVSVASAHDVRRKLHERGEQRAASASLGKRAALARG